MEYGVEEKVVIDNADLERHSLPKKKLSLKT